MPLPFKIILITFGTLVFLAHAAWALYSIRFYSTRTEKLEAAGIIVPGCSGLLMIAAALLLPSRWGILCAALTFPLLLIGRAVYDDLFVFRRWRS